MPGGDSKLNTIHGVLEDAEKLLLQGDYFSAEKHARNALSTAARLTNPDEKHSFGDRAAAVLLQALFETNRFSNARPSLITAFGSMEKSPPTTLLLWLSLALDTDEKSKAQTLMLNLLQAGPCRGAPVCRWNHRQYLALIHLYAIEVLLPALRDPSEVKLWLARQPFLPLDPRETQFLEDEVEAAAAAASLLAENGGNGNNTSGGSGALGGAGTGQGIEPSGSTDLDHMLGGGGGVGGIANGGGAVESGRRRVTDYSSMHLPTDQISPMKNPISIYNSGDGGGSGGGGGGDGRLSPGVAPLLTGSGGQHQNPPYMMSFSPVPSDLPFGTLAEYEQGQQENNNNSTHYNHQYNNNRHNNKNNGQQRDDASGTQRNGVSTTAAAVSSMSTASITSKNTTNSSNDSTNNTQQRQQQNGGGHAETSFIELDWLGKVQQAAFDGAGSVYSTIHEFIAAQRDNTTNSRAVDGSTAASASTSTFRKNIPGSNPSSSSRSRNNDTINSDAATARLATVVGLSIFAYALYSERAFIKNSARTAWRGVEDILKMAFLFSPNPLTPVTTQYIPS